MANLISVRLNRGDAPSWGFRLQGGKDFGTPLVVQKIIGGSPAERAGLIAGDTVVKINNVDVYNLRHKDAQDVILRAGPSFDIAIQRGGSTWKPAVAPVGSISTPRPAAPISNISPVTATSLAAGQQDSIGAIGTSHNLSAKPFQVNGGPRLVNKQYNSPLPLYSEQSIAETLSAQSEVLSNGVLGVNFKKNEKSYDASNSAVFRMVQEADKEPRDYEAEPDRASSGVITAPVGIAGLRHVMAPESKPTPPTPQLPPGQNICADCERLIVGVFVRIKDKNLHVECFKCSTCGTSLKNVGYYNLNNKLYCDVHAKLAARNNPPASNLQPVTVPPGGTVPAGAISAALASHSLPSLPLPAPLSPNTNYSATPFQPGASFTSSPRPFSSVSAPLSPPSSTLPKYSPTPAAPLPAASFSSAPLQESRCVQNTVWPPAQNEPELPTASPLYFPPPSQVQPTVKQLLKESENSLRIETDEADCCELQEMNYMAQNSERNLSLCSTEVFNITGRRSTMECSETIADTIDTQMLVESIVQSRPKSPPPIQAEITARSTLQHKPKPSPPGDVSVSFTISEAQLRQGAYENIEHLTSCETTESQEIKTCSLKEEKKSQGLASMYEKKIKVENTVPQKWESPMVTALTIASDKPYSQIQSKSTVEQQKVTSSDAFAQIPTKRSTSALASALATAPAEPFTPVNIASTLEPVPLPEETVPYLPPEHPIIIEPKQPKEDIDEVDSPFVQALKVAPEKPIAGATPKKKKDVTKDELFKDLPKPSEKISMLAALTTAPERPYSPFTAATTTYQTEMTENKQIELTKSTEKFQVRQESKKLDDRSLSKNVHFTENVAKSYPPFPSQSKLYHAEAAQTSHSKMVKKDTSESIQNKQESKQVMDLRSLEKSSKSESLSKNIQSTEDITKVSTGLPPLIQLVRSTFETSTDKVQMEMACQFLGDAAAQQQIIEKCTSKTDVHEAQSVQKSITDKKILHQETTEMSQKQIKGYESQQESEYSSCARKAFITHAPTITETTTGITESTMLQKATAHAQSEKHVEQKAGHSEAKSSNIRTYSQAEQGPPKERITVIQPGQTNLNVPQISFQPVNDEVPPNTTFSPRPRPLTPSMINKPAPVLPYYQASLVAAKCKPAETNLFDPTSPATSRSPSPYPGRPSSPFPSSTVRPVSPAPGPPANPLQSSKSLMELKNESKMQQARNYVLSYIPQHRSALSSSRSATNEAQKTSGLSQQSFAEISASQSNIDAASVMQKSFAANTSSQKNVGVASAMQSSKEQQLREVANIKSGNVEIQASSGQSIQIQKQKQVREEYEHIQKSKVIETEKYSTGTQIHSSQRTTMPVTENQAVVGFHLTNPQPLKSPFIATDDLSADKTAITSSTQSKIPQRVPQAEPGQRSTPASAIPKLTRVPSLTSGSIPTASASSNVNITRPNVSQPNAGTGGGRQAGAIGVAPKRGRGILNLAATPGSRVPLCGHCHSNIRGPFVTALGKIWCPDHFICATPSCRRPLHDLGFVEERGQLYCEYCFEQYLAPPCAKCNAKVKGDCLKAIGKNFHPECFSCVYCGKLFGNSPFFLEDAQPYCDADWNELFTTKCFACGFPVEAGDRWVEALNNNYHSQCFNCTMCKKNLEGQSFFAKGGRPFCKNHAR